MKHISDDIASGDALKEPARLRRQRVNSEYTCIYIYIHIIYISIYTYIYIICTVKPSQGKDEGRNDKCNEDLSQTQIVCHTDAFSAVEKELCLFQESEENWVCAPQFLISRIVGRRLLMCSFADLKKSPVKFGCVQGCRNSWNKSVK